MLDRANAGPDGVREPRSTVRVCGHVLPLALGLVDGHGDLLRGELGDQGHVVLGDEPAGRRELDPVGAGPEIRPNDPPHLIGPVSEVGRSPRIGG